MAVEAPVEPVGGRLPCLCCGGSGSEPAGVYNSPTSGRRYLPQITPAGVRYGLEIGGRFVHLEMQGHSIERGHAGWPSVDRYVDHLASKLRVWVDAVEAAKGYVHQERHRDALDGLIQRWVRWPAFWSTTRKHIQTVTKGVRLGRENKRLMMLCFERQSFVATFAE